VALRSVAWSAANPRRRRTQPEQLHRAGPGLPGVADQHAAAVASHPDRARVTVREETINAAAAAFIAERLLGPDRAAMLAATLPANAAEQTARHADRAGHLRKQLARTDTADRAP
jgi:hypothetical protein